MIRLMLLIDNTALISSVLRALKASYLSNTNFRGYIFSRISCLLAIFAKINTREIFLDVKFPKINIHEIFLQLKFVKINTREKSLSGREDKKDITFQNTTYIFPKPNLLQLNHIVCFSF